MAETRFADILMKPRYHATTTLSSRVLALHQSCHLRFPNLKILCSFCDHDGSKASALEHTKPPPVLSTSIIDETTAKSRRGRPRQSLGLSEHLRSKSEKASFEEKTSPREMGKIDSSEEDVELKPKAKSRRGRTRQSLGINQDYKNSREEASAEESSIYQGAVEFTASEDTRSPNIKPVIEDDIESSPDAWIRASMPSKDNSVRNQVEQLKAFRRRVENASTKELKKLIRSMINADLDRRFEAEKMAGDDDDYPLYVDEDDPYWLDEPDEGWGFRVSDHFKDKTDIKEDENKNDSDNDEDTAAAAVDGNNDDDEHSENDDDHIGEMDWNAESEIWCARDIDSMLWTETVFFDPTPLVILVYDRDGIKARECYHVLKELEDAANRIWETNRLPPRLVKINAGVERDLVAALRVKEFPTLIFVKAKKVLHRQSGYFTADNLMRIIGYFYHGAMRPPCLKVIQTTPEDVPRKV